MIKFRKAKLGDEIGISQIMKEGLKRNSFKYTGTNKYTTKKLETLKNTLSSNKSTSYFFVAINSISNQIVGSINYQFKKSGRLRHRVGLGWWVHPDFEGQGIGTKLLDFALTDATKKGFKRAEAEIAIKNIGSLKIALKCGFEIEGTKKKALLTDDGEYIDTHIVGKLL
jgi:RimJ/RimL family protein N-acetyltransferase